MANETALLNLDINVTLIKVQSSRKYFVLNLLTSQITEIDPSCMIEYVYFHEAKPSKAVYP